MSCAVVFSKGHLSVWCQYYDTCWVLRTVDTVLFIPPVMLVGYIW